MKVPNFSSRLFVYFFGNIFMIGESVHTATSKEMRAPQLMFSFEQAPQLSVTDLKVNWVCFQQQTF